MAKSNFKIVAGASVVVVRDGKRVTLGVNSGEEFTEDEIAAVNRAVPGALRSPINEGRNKKTAVAENDGDDGDDEDGDDDTASKTTAKAKAKTKAKASSDEDGDI